MCNWFIKNRMCASKITLVNICDKTEEELHQWKGTGGDSWYDMCNVKNWQKMEIKYDQVKCVASTQKHFVRDFSKFNIKHKNQKFTTKIHYRNVIHVYKLKLPKCTQHKQFHFQSNLYFSHDFSLKQLITFKIHCQSVFISVFHLFKNKILHFIHHANLSLILDPGSISVHRWTRYERDPNTTEKWKSLK
jgi:hypothetical protein